MSTDYSSFNDQAYQSHYPQSAPGPERNHMDAYALNSRLITRNDDDNMSPCMLCMKGTLPAVGAVGGFLVTSGYYMYNKDEAYNWGHTGTQISDARLGVELACGQAGVVLVAAANVTAAVAQFGAKLSELCCTHVFSRCCDTSGASRGFRQFGKHQLLLTMGGSVAGVGGGLYVLGNKSKNDDDSTVNSAAASNSAASSSSSTGGSVIHRIARTIAQD